VALFRLMGQGGMPIFVVTSRQFLSAHPALLFHALLAQSGLNISDLLARRGELRADRGLRLELAQRALQITLQPQDSAERKMITHPVRPDLDGSPKAGPRFVDATHFE